MSRVNKAWMESFDFVHNKWLMPLAIYLSSRTEVYALTIIDSIERIWLYLSCDVGQSHQIDFSKDRVVVFIGHHLKDKPKCGHHKINTLAFL